MSQALLLEIGTEDLPASYIPPALEQLAREITALLDDFKIVHSHPQTYGTPRRLAILVDEVFEKQERKVVEVIGPPKNQAFDEEGNPTPAATGFAKTLSIEVSELKEKETPKGRYVYAEKIEEPRETIDLLEEHLPKIITSLIFPKSMRWGTIEFQFARPIRWLLALFGTEVINFELATVSSSNKTYGHRFLSNGPHKISHASEYNKILEENFVIPSPTQRKEIIQDQLKRFVHSIDAELIPNEALLETVTYLVEFPYLLCGEFNEVYLKIPQAVLIATICKHQKYFPIKDKSGRLLHKFGIVANTNNAQDIVRKGNERVVEARLSDAAFFWDTDRAVPIDEFVSRQNNVIWQESLGTLYEKTLRLIKLSQFLANQIEPAMVNHVKRAAWLCKADLLTKMVYEFPELEGIMGYYYALEAGEPPEVAIAIKEHYLPRGVTDESPDSIPGLILAIADKIDTIVGFFSIGLIPTGSQDPYGLRRAATGIIINILSKECHLSLTKLIEEAINLLTAVNDKKSLFQMVILFFGQRMEYIMISKGIRQDIAMAILKVGFDQPQEALIRAQSLQEFCQLPSIEPLIITFKRVMNILKGITTFHDINIDLLIEREEEALYNAYLEAEERIENYILKSVYPDVLSTLANLRASVDWFFDKVMVMVDEPSLRENRLALMHRIASLFLRLADFSCISAVS